MFGNEGCPEGSREAPLACLRVLWPKGMMIKVSHLVKRYGTRTAVSDLSFEVEKGEVVGFLGPNGAGKSSTLRILAGVFLPTSGEVSIMGHDVARDSMKARAQIGYMPEAAPLYPEMRVAEYLSFRAELKEVPRSKRLSFVADAMEKANVVDVQAVPIAKLSKGYKQRVGLADALVARPPLLILDEPTAGLDPNQIRAVRDVLRELGNEHTVLLSTHILSEVEASCERAIVIANGKLVANGTLREIQAQRRPVGAMLVVRGEEAAIRRTFAAAENVCDLRLTPSGETLACEFRWKDSSSPAEPTLILEGIVSGLVANGIHIREVRSLGGTLEDVFEELTRGEKGSA